MILLGLRLLFHSGREALGRLSAIVAGVMLGVAVLLTILSGFTALNMHDARAAWLATEGPAVTDSGVGPGAVLWQRTLDTFHGMTIDRIDTAADGTDVRLPGGMPLPAPGKYYVSPAMAALTGKYPANQLADRFEAKQAGVLDKAMLGSANDLIAVVGHQPDDLRQVPGVMAVTKINAAPRGTDSGFIRIILAVGAAGIIFPAAMFVAVSTRLAAARREERFVAIRLIGGTKRQIIALATVEAAVGALVGWLLGYVLFLPAPYILAHYEFAGIQFYREDLHITLSQFLLIGAGVVSIAVALALVALRKINISPLGVARKAPAKPPRAWRSIPLLLGMGGVAYMAYKDGSAANVPSVIVTFLLCGIGVFLMGPWVARLVARVLNRAAVGPAVLIASSRLLTQPTAIFRAVSGIVIAVFVVSVFSAVMTAFIVSVNDRKTVIPSSTLVVGLRGGAVPEKSNGQYHAVQTALAGSPDVLDTTTLYEIPKEIAVRGITVEVEGRPEIFTPTLLLPCEQGQQLGFGTCPPDQFVLVHPYVLYNRQSPPEGWQYVAADTAHLSPAQLLVETDGRADSIERIRTAVVRVTDGSTPAMTDEELYASSAKMFTQLQSLANLGILIILLVAGCSLLVAVADSLLERKRPFTLLRLTGMSLNQLRSTVMLEAAIPLIVTAFLATATGLLFGGLLLKAVGDAALMPPSPGFLLTLLGGVGLSLAVVACTLPLLGRLTRSDNARFE